MELFKEFNLDIQTEGVVEVKENEKKYITAAQQICYTHPIYCDRY